MNAYLFQGEIKEPGYDRIFAYHPLSKSHLNQEHDNKNHQTPFPESIEQLFEKQIIIFLCEDCLTGNAYFTYICSWLNSCRRLWVCTWFWFLSGKYHIQCLILTIWSVVWYRPVLLSLTCSCILNVLSLPVVLSNVESVASSRCCKPHIYNLNQRIVYPS